MNLFALVAAIVALGHALAAVKRPRLSLFVAGILWLLYAVWERLIANGTLCTSDCNIRVDLALILPVLAIASGYAYWSYVRPPEQKTVLGWILGAVGLVIIALASGAFGFNIPAVVAGVCALAIGGYVLKSRFAAQRT